MAISARLLAKRVLANEELARQRGVATCQPDAGRRRVIEEMQDGVLVVARREIVPAGTEPPGGVDARFARGGRCAGLRIIPQRWQRCRWRWGIGGSSLSSATPAHAALAVVPTESSERDVLVFLGAWGRVHGQRTVE